MTEGTPSNPSSPSTSTLSGFRVLYEKSERWTGNAADIANATPVACPKCLTSFHGNRTVVVDKEGHTCSGENEYPPDSIDVLKDMPRTPMKRIIYTMPDKDECDRIIKRIREKKESIKQENGQPASERPNQAAKQDA